MPLHIPAAQFVVLSSFPFLSKVPRYGQNPWHWNGNSRTLFHARSPCPGSSRQDIRLLWVSIIFPKHIRLFSFRSLFPIQIPVIGYCRSGIYILSRVLPWLHISS